MLRPSVAPLKPNATTAPASSCRASATATGIVITTSCNVVSGKQRAQQIKRFNPLLSKNCFADKQNVACAALNCSYNCKLTPQGARCYCPGGQVPESANSTRCVDYDECSVPGTCDQQCRNTPGSYECSCISGYTKQGSHCRAINGELRKL